jgi:transcriptional regulator with XRE-family HTH domain
MRPARGKLLSRIRETISKQLDNLSRKIDLCNVNMDIVRRINDFLGIKDWSARHLALESGIPKTVIYRILAHEISPTFEQIEKICNAFNVTVEEFFYISFAPKADEVVLLNSYRKLNNQSKKMLIYMIEAMK